MEFSSQEHRTMFELIVKTIKGTNVANLLCTEQKCTLGKSADCLVNLHGWKVDKEHAIFYATPDGIFVNDNNTKFGTLVNGKKISTFGPLSKSDQIQINAYNVQVINRQKRQSNDFASLKAGDEISSNDKGIETNRAKHQQTGNKSEIAFETKEKNQDSKKELETKNDVEKNLLRQWREIVHQELLKQMDLRRINVNEMSDDELKQLSDKLIKGIVSGLTALPKEIVQSELCKQVLDEAVGLGPLEELLEMEGVSEIMVNASDEIFYEKDGQLFESSVTFTNDKAVLSAIERIVAPLGRRIDESSPAVDARLKDGSRVNAIIPPIALKGPCITIRRFMKERLTAEHLIGFGSISPEMVKFLENVVKFKQNAVISGGTGSGKTTLLNVLSNFIPENERIITVEDAAELKLCQTNLVSLEARPPNQEGKGAVPIRELVKNCLRMRPDRIVVGECRGGEALDMLQAMNTGHDGSLTTAHANNPRDCISRLEIMIMMAGMELPILAIREQIASAVNIVVQQTRFACGTRKVTSICEISGVEGDRVQLGEIFRFKQTDFDEKGKIRGHFEATGIVPEFYELLAKRGIEVDMDIFSSGRVFS